MNFRTFPLLAMALASQLAMAEGFWSQFEDPDDGRFDASAFLAENAYGFLPLPVIITDPAVDGGLGLVGLFFHETDEQKEKRLKALRNAENGSQFLLTPSVSAVGGAVTGNDSWAVGGGHMAFLKQGRVRYLVGGGYGDVNLDFFGFGEVQMLNPLELNTRAAAVVQSLRFRVGESKVFAGVLQRFVDARIRPNSLGGLSGDILPPEFQDRWQEFVRDLLTRDVRTSALGIVVEFDSRNNFFSPHSGYRYKLEQLWYRDFFGSDIEYELTSLSGLNYWPLGGRFRAALRVAVDYATTGSLLPPFAMPGIDLRGVPAGRYQGNFVGLAEAQLAWQVDDRWSLLAFAGSGRAASSYSEFREAPSRVTKGAGFRYLIARRYGFEMGLDVARGPEETVFYIQAGSAW